MPESVNIKVVGRCRPLTADDASKSAKTIVKINGDKISVESNGKEQSFSFDGAYGGDAKNEQIFKEKGDPILQRAMEGYNVTFMAFGATGSGKSYTMTGSDSDPGIGPCVIRRLYQLMAEKGNREFFTTVSYLEVHDGKMSDLLNPHNSPMKVRQHPHRGIYVEGLSEIVASDYDEMSRLYDQGTRARKMGTTDSQSHKKRAQAMFFVTLEQRERQSSKVGVRSVITIADLAGPDVSGTTDSQAVSGIQSMLNVLSALGGPKKGGAIPHRDSVVTRVLQESLGGNAVSMMFATVSPVDKHHQETYATLQYASYAKATKNHVRMNMNPYDETSDIIQDLRDEISKLRDRIASTSEPKKDDVLKMEDLVQDLQIAKRSTWEERERQSRKYEEERKVNLANKGVLEWVTDNVRKGNKELQERIGQLQRDRDQLTAQYKEKRNAVDAMNEDLQKRIAEYSKYTETGKASESETKKRVTAIHDLKEKLKRETETLKKIKQQIKDVQDKQKAERDDAKAQMTAMKGSAEVRQKVEMEERQRLELENKTLVAEELEKMKIDVEQEKAEIQVRMADGKKYTPQEGASLECQVAELKSEKNVVVFQLQTIQQEKARLVKELEEVYRLHKDEMEIQQLQHFQTFRSYREMFEEQKAAIDHRYRQLLEDSIQDAVFLSSRNNELTEENSSLRQQIAEMKDVITKLGGRIPSQPGMTA